MLSRHHLFAFLMALMSTHVLAAKEPQIASNQSSIQDSTAINSIASSAIAMGAKEPVNISENQSGGKRVLTVSGSNGIQCKVPVSDNNKMAGINCK